MERRERSQPSEAQKEIGRLYLQYREKLLLYVKITVWDETVADDIVQEVFVEAIRKYETFRGHPNQFGWLYRTAKYKIMEYGRKVWQLQESTDETVDCVGEDDSSYSVKELHEAFRKSLTGEELLRYRRYFLWGYSMDEMACLEGVSVNNMRVRITRLRQKLIHTIEKF